MNCVIPINSYTTAFLKQQKECKAVILKYCPLYTDKQCIDAVDNLLNDRNVDTNNYTDMYNELCQVVNTVYPNAPTTRTELHIVNTLKNIQPLSQCINNVPKQNWIIDKILPEQGLVFFVGQSEGRKTWVAMHIALCCCTGKLFLNNFNVKKKCKVLYIDEENGDVTLLNRFKKIYNAYNDLQETDLEYLRIASFAGFKLDSEEGRQHFCTVVEREMPNLVVVDSQVRCMEGDENSAQDVRKIFDTVKDVIHKLGICVIILHHTPKSNPLDARGSGDFKGMADSIFTFVPDDENYSLIHFDVGKTRLIDRNKWQPFDIEMQSSSHLTRTEDGLPEECITFNYKERQLNAEAKTLTGQCISSTEKYILENNISELDTSNTGEWKSLMTTMGFKLGVLKETIQQMVEEKRLEAKSKGKYTVKKDKLKQFQLISQEID